MFLDAAILILQEILEASLLISVLQVLTTSLRMLWPVRTVPRNDWIFSGLGWGFGGAVLYGWTMPFAAAWFDYAGYEIINAFLQASMVLGLLAICTVLNLRDEKMLRQKIARVSMILVVALGIVREGSEIILYLQGIMSQPENITPALLAAVMAAGIGGSSGLLLYYVICSLPSLYALRAALVLLALFAGNMSAQAIALLTQADWLPYTAELWNSSFVLPEDAITGRVLYALIGYEANPSLLQVIGYVAAALVLVQSPLFRGAWLALSPPADLADSTVRKQATNL